MDDPAAVVLYVTCPDRATALAIAGTVVEERLAACANCWGGMTSIYRWEGRTEQAEEAVLLLKTVPARQDALIARVQALHPYRTPCVLALPVAAGAPAFLAWLAAETAGS